MKYIKKHRDKYGLLTIKKGETRIYDIRHIGSLKCMCTYFKKTKGYIFHVNKMVDEKGVEWAGVTMDKKCKKNIEKNEK